MTANNIRIMLRHISLATMGSVTGFVFANIWWQ